MQQESSQGSIKNFEEKVKEMSEAVKMTEAKIKSGKRQAETESDFMEYPKKKVNLDIKTKGTPRNTSVVSRINKEKDEFDMEDYCQWKNNILKEAGLQ